MDLQTQLMEQKMKVDFNSYDLTIKELRNCAKIIQSFYVKKQ